MGLNKLPDNEENRIADEALAIEAQAGSELALEGLIDRYKPMLISLSNRYFIRGNDKDDVVQEAMIGFSTAVQAFELGERNRFSAFAKIATEQHIIDSIRKSEKLNHQVLSDAVSIEKLDYEIADDSVDVETDADEGLLKLLANEEFRKQFSPLEWDVLVLRVRDFSYKEIAERLDRSYKAVDNALQRIKKKLNDSE